MRLAKWIAVALALSVASAGAEPSNYKTFNETQILTRAVPSTSATDGMSLSGVTGYRVTVTAPSGQTISGGTLKCYLYSLTLARWMRCKSTFDITPTTGVRDYASEDFKVSVGAGRILYATDTVTLSGAGTTVIVTIDARTW